MSAKNHFIQLLNKNASIKNDPPKLSKKVAHKLIERIKSIRLYAHSYSFSLNFQKGDFDTIDLLNFAHENKLNGIVTHTNFGGKNSLKNKSKKSLKDIRIHAKKLNLGINLEISSTSKKEVDSVVEIAKILGVKNIRVYIRQRGHVSEIIEKATKDLKYISNISNREDLLFVLEPHEVLKSKELVQIIKKINSPRIKLMFDFGNMINAGEDPIDALKITSPHVSLVHMKGVKKVKIKKGSGQMGVLEGEDDLPQMRMLFTLLLLGNSTPQVKSYALEQEVGYKSLPYRFEGEEKDPMIPSRGPSVTRLNKNKSVKENLQLERKNAINQVRYVRNLLKQMDTMSKLIIKE